MDIAPLQFIGAFLAACLVLAIAWATEGLNLQWHPRQLKLRWHFSLGMLMILVTAFAGIMTLVAVYLKK
jgi:hypothetical protein